MLAGAVYKPVALTVPAPTGLTVQFTLAVVAVNCCVCKTPKVAVCGVTPIVEINSFTVAVPDFDASATLVACTVTV